MKKILAVITICFLAAGCATKQSGSSTASSTAAPATTGSAAVTLTPIQISEWGVEFTPTQSISDIRYAIDPNHSDTADFTTASLSSLDGQTGGSMCSVLNAPLGTLSRVVSFSAFTAEGHAIPANKLIGQYYYYYQPSNGNCSSNVSVENMQSLQTADLRSSLDSLVAIPSK